MCVSTHWKEILQKKQCTFFKRLRNRGYGRKFLTTLFGKVKFGYRNKLLKISEDIIDEFEIGTQRSDSALIEDAERMFQDVFSEVVLPMENIQQNIHTVCIDSVNPVITVQKVCLWFYQLYFGKKHLKPKNSLWFLSLFFIPFSGRRNFWKAKLGYSWFAIAFQKENQPFVRERTNSIV